MSFVFLILFLVPIAALCWRVVVTKTHAQWLRAGGAAAVMVSLVGSFAVFGHLTDFRLRQWRNDIALLAAMASSVYLLLWALRRRGNRRHRTVSMLAAMLGLVPVGGAILTAIASRFG